MSEQDIIVDAIAKYGDVVLVVGADTQDPVQKLRVNSHFLRDASAVFNAMLSPSFAEGQGLSFDQPKEIDLPEGDAVAMRLICHVLHCKTTSSSTNPSPSVLNEIALVADKYDLRRALWLASDVWLRPNESDSIEMLAQRIEASVLMDRWDALEVLTKQLLLTYTPPCARFGYGSGCPRFFQIIRSLEDKRNHILTTFQDHLMRTFRDGCTSHSCCCARRYLNDLSKVLEERKLYPSGAALQSLAEISAVAKTIPYPVDSTYRESCKCPFLSAHLSPLSIRRALHERVEEMSDIKGLSYEDIPGF